MDTALTVFFVFINLLTFLFFAADKRRARLHMRRIRESTLLLLCLLGGALGGLVAMLICRHKTQKSVFRLGVPFLLVLNLAAFWALDTLAL